MKAIKATLIVVGILAFLAAYLYIAVITAGLSALVTVIVVLWLMVYDAIGGFRK